MNADEKTVGMMEFIGLFTLLGEPQAPVTLEGKAWDEERGVAVPSGEMVTWTPRHPPQPVRQIVPGINPPPIEGDLQVSTVWDREQGRCVFKFHRPREALEPKFIVDERGVRSLLPDVAEMSFLPLADEEKLVLLEEAQSCNLTWPVSLNEVRAWAERMGYEVAESEGTADEEQKPRPGPKPDPLIVAAIDLAVRLHKEEGKTKEKAAYEAAMKFGVNEDTVRRKARQRTNAT
jgi:hypothetical protein